MNQHFPFGLDISDLKLRVIQLDKSFKKIGIISYNEVSLPQGYIVNGLIKKIDKVASLIKQLKSKAKGRRIFQKRVIACLPEKQSFIKVIYPKNLQEETVKKSAEKHLHFNFDEIYFDWQILNQQDNSVLIGACKKEIVDSYLITLKKADLVAEVLENETESLARALLDKKNSNPVLIIDIGYARTTLLIHFNQSIQFTTSLESVIKNNTINIDKLQQFTEKVVHFHQGHFNEEGFLEKIILCGSGAYSPKTSKLLNAAIQIPVEQGNPWLHITSKRNQKKIPNIFGYTTAIGLALRSVQNKEYI